MSISSARWRTCFGRSLQGSFSVLASIALLFFPAHAFAHPMGNFSISHYSGITIGRGFLDLRYLIDMAEIPTFQEMQQNGIVARQEDPRLPAYLSAKAAEFAQGLHATLNGRALPLHVVSLDVIFPTGAGNLPTMKFGFSYRAQIAVDCTSAPCQLDYEDANFPGRAGWKEVVVTTGQEIALISSTAPDRDRSGRLSNYPTNLLNSAPQQLQASLVFSAIDTQSSSPASRIVATKRGSFLHKSRGLNNHAAPASVTASSQHVPAGGATSYVPLKPNQQATPRNAFTELLATKQAGFGVALLAAMIAAGLGALHALEPGHGKTIVAAYLVGSKGTARHALLLGIIVTVSHTAGVYLLGVITLYAQRYILPDRIYPFFGVLSGILIAGMGFYLILHRYVGVEFAHTHSCQMSVAAEGSNGGMPPQPGRVSSRQLFLLGVTGGIVPCPAALVVLLSAAALHRTVFGLFLIVAFSFGLAAMLIVMGLTAVYALRLMSRLPLEGPLVQRWLPMGSAAMIILLGFGIALRGLMAAGIVQIRVWS